ncbi:unnamed protein product [Trichobilharzia szidati]|nr:unnamed protein product [Trichobilharzia szidati]CAH8876187.1 unnamed protein product [Trichobilharzia szidati]CAH8876189.1 unnamed protein product [Trichobilharzia szidati]
MTQEAKWIEVFNKIDKDKNGSLSLAEVQQCFKEIKVDPKLAENFIKETDANDDGKVSLDEYLGYLKKVDKCNTAIEGWKRVFQQIDKDNSGKVSIKEMEEFTQSSGAHENLEDLRKWIAENDKDKDGEINCEEFLDCVRKSCK